MWPFKKERNVKITKSGTELTLWIEDGKNARMVCILEGALTGFIRTLNSIKKKNTAAEIYLDCGEGMVEVFYFPSWSIRESLRLLTDALLDKLERKDATK